MAEIIQMPPSPNVCEKECVKALKNAQLVAADCIGVLTGMMRDDTISPTDRIEAIRTLLYYGLELELTNNG